MHHAHLLLGLPEEAESYLCSLCDKLGIKLKNNPDFFAFRMDTFGIDEARQLGVLSARKTITSAGTGQAGKKIFLIAPTHLTLEAQNALLKVFEDPFPDTYFFLAIRGEGLILPTLRSRMQITRLSRGSASEHSDAKYFLSLSLKERLLFAKKFADEDEKLPVFLDDMLSLLKKENKQSLIKNIYNIRRFADDSAAASRMIIEHLSLVL